MPKPASQRLLATLERLTDAGLGDRARTKRSIEDTVESTVADTAALDLENALLDPAQLGRVAANTPLNSGRLRPF